LSYLPILLLFDIALAIHLIVILRTSDAFA